MDSLPLFGLNQTYLIAKSEASMKLGDAMRHEMNKPFSSTALKNMPGFEVTFTINFMIQCLFVFSLSKEANRVFLRLVYSCNCRVDV